MHTVKVWMALLAESSKKKEEILWIFMRQDVNPVIDLQLWLSIKLDNHKYWEIYDYEALADSVVP